METRDDLKQHLQTTKNEFTVLKLYADWCAPCKAISPFVNELVKKKEETVEFDFFELNVDESFDLYGFLKSKKMARGIPTILIYKKSAYTHDNYYIPFTGVSGAKKEEIEKIFNLIK